jgi:hypothetical protein
MSPELAKKLKKLSGKDSANGKASASPVKSFSFELPSTAWTIAEPTSGDSNFTKAGFTMSGTSVRLEITSIGRPTTGKDASALVKECETGFAQGSAKHADMARSWVIKGFSVSRYADPTSGDVFMWCASETSKLRLNFSFGAGSRVNENIKIADSTTDEFFAKNPSGGAKLK